MVSSYNNRNSFVPYRGILMNLEECHRMASIVLISQISTLLSSIIFFKCLVVVKCEHFCTTTHLRLVDYSSLLNISLGRNNSLGLGKTEDPREE